MPKQSRGLHPLVQKLNFTNLNPQSRAIMQQGEREHSLGNEGPENGPISVAAEKMRVPLRKWQFCNKMPASFAFVSRTLKTKVRDHAEAGGKLCVRRGRGGQGELKHCTAGRIVGSPQAPAMRLND
jgi:hypothetical protein